MDIDKIFKVYLGDYSKEGYSSGLDDRKEQKPNNKFKFFTVANPINYILRFDNSFDSFSKNYDKGYLDAQRVENEVYNVKKETTNNKGVTMAQDNYERHLSMLKNFQSNLRTLQASNNMLREKYVKQLLAMEQAGFVENISRPLQVKYQAFKREIDTLNENIDKHHMKLNLPIEYLENLINTSKEE
jgi:hypothetical protein